MQAAIGITNPNRKQYGSQRLVAKFSAEDHAQIIEKLGPDPLFQLHQLTDGFALFRHFVRHIGFTRQDGVVGFTHESRTNKYRLTITVRDQPAFACVEHLLQEVVFNGRDLIIELPSPKERRPAITRKQKRKKVTRKPIRSTTATDMFLTEHDTFDVPKDVSKAIHRMLAPYKRGA